MPGLVRAVGRTAVIAGTATAVSNRVSRRQAGRWAAQDPYQQQPQAYPEPAPAAAAPPVTDKVTSLTQLAQLRDQGVLTEAEFELEKHRILSA
jgi:hypothetical protein